MFNQQVAFLILTHQNTAFKSQLHSGHCCPDARLPVAAVVHGRWRHTAAAGLSSGFHVSDVDVTSRSSASCPPGLQTGKTNADGHADTK